MRQKHSSSRPTAIGLLAGVLFLLTMGSCVRLDPEDWSVVKRGIRERYPDVVQLTTTDLARWQARTDTVQPVLLDVRTAEEFAVSHLPMARRAEEMSEALQIIADLPAGTPVVLYCSVGYRSSRLAHQLVQTGVGNMANLEGSLFMWANENRPLVDADGEPTRLVHPYNDTWSGLLTADLVWTAD